MRNLNLMPVFIFILLMVKNTFNIFISLIIIAYKLFQYSKLNGNNIIHFFIE